MIGLPGKSLSNRMMIVSDQMYDLALELNEKHHLNAVELSGAAMILADWALEVRKDEIFNLGGSK